MPTAAEILYGGAAASSPAAPVSAPTSSAAARLYPDHVAAPPTATATEAGPVLPAGQASAQGANDPAVPDAPAAPERATPGQALYADLVPTHGRVDFAEPVVPPEQIKLQVPMGWDNGPEAQAERAQFVEALADAGAGRTMAREVWADIAQAAARPVTVTQEAAMADLRKAWGPAADAKLAAARGLVAKVADRYPGAIEFLERTGLGNDPAFIRKLAARAARMPAP